MKLCLGLPWYAGPDPTTYPLYFEFLNYFGRLKERTLWRQEIGHEKFIEISRKMLACAPNPHTAGGGLAEPNDEDWERLGVLDVSIADYSRVSLPGKARELCVEAAQGWGADYILMWDADMKFKLSAFLRLWRHQKPVVAALAFTAREPVHPVIYRIREEYDPVNKHMMFTASDVVLDYEKDRLITNADVGGAIAFGAGMLLIDMKVFRQIPQPWFNSTGCGEDWFFCTRCHEYKVQRFVDTSVKTEHKMHAARWVDDKFYEESLVRLKDKYREMFPESFAHLPVATVTERADGKTRMFDQPIPSTSPNVIHSVNLLLQNPPLSAEK